MRKIFFHLPQYPNWYDGATKYQTKVFEYFKKKNEEVYVFGRTIGVKQSRYWVVQNLYKLLHFIGIIIGTIHIFRIPKNSLILINNGFFLHYLIPIAFNKYWKKHVYILIVHDLIQKERPTFLRETFENYFIRNSDLVIANSKTTCDDLVKLKLISKDCNVVYPGLDVDFSLVPQKKLFPEKIKLLYVGSIEKRKGLIYLVEALSKISNLDFELNLVGGQKFPAYFKLLCEKINEIGLSKKVFFRGRVSSDELLNYYLNSSIFVFPTLYEGYGMAVAEAMGYALPVLSTKIPAVSEFVENRKEGFLVEPGNSKELGNALEIMLHDIDLLKYLSRNALSKAKTLPCWDESSEKIWQIVGTHLDKK